jgi:hypothetical protein
VLSSSVRGLLQSTTFKGFFKSAFFREDWAARYICNGWVCVQNSICPEINEFRFQPRGAKPRYKAMCGNDSNCRNLLQSERQVNDSVGL